MRLNTPCEGEQPFDAFALWRPAGPARASVGRLHLQRLTVELVDRNCRSVAGATLQQLA
jgi:hypothetical protein